MTFMRHLSALAISGALGVSSSAYADHIEIRFEQPHLAVDPYHRPFVAIWLEDDNKQGLQTQALWYNDSEWLKDLRQWWRKLGRQGAANFDAVTSATKRPGSYTLSYSTADGTLPNTAAGVYHLCIEAAREAGGRNFWRQRIELGAENTQSYHWTGEGELANVSITIQP